MCHGGDNSKQSLPKRAAGVQVFLIGNEGNAERAEFIERGEQVLRRPREAVKAPVIVYDATSLSWFEQIRRKVRHIGVIEQNPTPLTFQCYACIIVALRSPELEAVLRLPWGWQEWSVPSDVTLYYRAEVKFGEGSRTVFAAAAPRMGMTSSASLCSKMIELFRPEHVVMPGIAAGVKGRVKLGDVLVADPCWDWGSGKWRKVGEASELAPAPHQIGLHSAVKFRIERLAANRELLDRIRNEWAASKPTETVDVIIGPVASGAAVLADPAQMELIEKQHRKVVGIEMEIYGVYAACLDARLPQPTPLAIKAVCDFADASKDDQFQSYAAYVSAQILRQLIET